MRRGRPAGGSVMTTRSPVGRFVVWLAAAVLVAGCSPGAPLQATPDPPAPSAPPVSTEAPTSAAPTMATFAVASHPTVSPDPTPTATWVDGPGVGSSVEAVELVDPAGDATWMDLNGATVTAPPGRAPAIDVSRVVAWIANGSLTAEVTMEGTPPPVSGDPASIRLRVKHGEWWYETPIVCDAGCRRWGTFFPVPPFTFLVRWLPTRWVATFTIRLAVLDGADSATKEYGVGVEAQAYPAGFSGAAAIDQAPDGLAPAALLVVTDAP
jgi:hypothetical protein